MSVSDPVLSNPLPLQVEMEPFLAQQKDPGRIGTNPIILPKQFPLGRRGKARPTHQLLLLIKSGLDLVVAWPGRWLSLLLQPIVLDIAEPVLNSLHENRGVLDLGVLWDEIRQLVTVLALELLRSHHFAHHLLQVL
jgi:hypothetical protein